MKIGISSLSLMQNNFDEIINKIKRYEEIRLWEIIDEGLHQLNNERVRVLKEYPVEYTIHAPFSDLNIASLVDEIRRLSIKILLKSLEHAYKLEAKVWILHPGAFSPLSLFFPEKVWKTNINTLCILANKAQRMGVQFAVENLFGWGRLLRTLDEIVKFIDEIDCENVSLCVDTGHLNIAIKNDIVEVIDKLLNWTVEFHLHDNDGDKDNHLKIGSGNINWRGLFRLIRNKGFNKYIILENLSFPDAIKSYRIIKEELINI